MPDTNFAGSAPEGDANGLSPYVGEILAGARTNALWPVIAVLDCASEKVDYRKGGRTPTMGVRRIEIVLPEDRKAVARILARTLERRTGKAVLPLDLEDQIEQAFGLVDPEDGGDG